MAKVVIVIPTYNERESAEKMIKALALELGKIKNHKVEVLYVDDTSPDKTYKIVEKYAKKYSWLHLLQNRKKEGLGRAYAKGFKYAIEKLSADYVMEFDGDFQHRPDEIKKLINKIDDGYEYIIGSRYIPGGCVPRQWGWDRKFLSRFGNFVARVALLLPHVHDVTTGFKLTKVRGILDKVDLENLYSNNFAYKIQILGECIQNGARWVEVPITFMPRVSGESKIIKNEIIETLKVIIKVQIKNPRVRKFMKFGIVGFVGYVVNATGIYFFAKLRFPEWAIWASAVELAIINNFFFNNIWTFKKDKIVGLSRWIYKFFQFNLTSAGALIIQTVFGTLGVYAFGPEYRQILLPVIIVSLIMPYNYFMYNVVIWKSWNLAKIFGKN